MLQANVRSLLAEYSYPSTGIEPIITDLTESGDPDRELGDLPAAAFESREFFDFEMDAVFRRMWIPVAHVSQVSQIGDYLAVDILNESFMIVRGEDEEVRVLSRSCLHRWAALVEGWGNIPGKRIACPFHKWIYDLSGQLVGVPLMQKAADFDRRECKLPSLVMRISNGVVLASLVEGRQLPIGEDDTALMAEILAADGPARNSRLTVDQNWKAVWQNIIENAGADLSELDGEIAWTATETSVIGKTGKSTILASAPSTLVIACGDYRVLITLAPMTPDSTIATFAWFGTAEYTDNTINNMQTLLTEARGTFRFPAPQHLLLKTEKAQLSEHFESL